MRDVTGITRFTQMRRRAVTVLATENEVRGHDDAFTSPDISPHVITSAVNNIHEFMVRRTLVAVLNCTELDVTMQRLCWNKSSRG